ncbi:4'-phosphopantetheinyl transferase family protein [Chryseobacterium polytrichastri]|uniref:4'-phosphopantetheinyl transferase n=1 Tax=Chryseobacterium polytrichastri TaxID=1302687 RepID=A0A1M6W9C9_9FLAO|nr:4'-phosphopantetheinyl transferase superfamily protein [Chryseobacterium polytrichastri]SHK90297.1 4'-phosphopantetheinyl transferase [Chryseobacterium polytrichastri]
MEVWVAYSFLNKNNSERVDELFDELPVSIKQSVERYQDPNDRLARKISKLLLETLIRKSSPYQSFFWDLYQKDDFSKPYIKGSEFDFSSSHSKNLVVSCLSLKGKCGIDTEFIQPLNIEIYNNFLHLEERRFIKSHQNPQAAFYEIWIKKEASLKASGFGISKELGEIDAHQEKVIIEDDTYFTKPLFLSPDYINFIASDFRITDLHTEEIIF